MDTPERRERKRLALQRFRERNPGYNAKQCRAWREANAEHLREYEQSRYTVDRKVGNRERYEQNRERYKAIQRAYTAAHMDDLLAYNEGRKHSPEVKARKAVYRAVKSGKLVKPSRCDDCQQEKTNRQLHGHHEDYSRPLDVLWLCAVCHGKRHRAD